MVLVNILLCLTSMTASHARKLHKCFHIHIKHLLNFLFDFHTFHHNEYSLINPFSSTRQLNCNLIQFLFQVICDRFRRMKLFLLLNFLLCFMWAFYIHYICSLLVIIIKFQNQSIFYKQISNILKNQIYFKSMANLFLNYCQISLYK